MGSDAVWVTGSRVLLPEIQRKTMRQRCDLFPRRHHRRMVVRAFLQRKLKALKVGVHWERITGCRFRRTDFPAIKKREFRWVRGEFRTKRSRLKHSWFVRRKVATHFILSGCAWQVDWDNVSAHPLFVGGLLRREDVQYLLRPFSHLPLTRKAREHLRLECQSAASCTWSHVFGKGNFGTGR